MPYYHIFVNYTDKRGNEHSLCTYDQTARKVRKHYAHPVMKRIPFFCLGYEIQPSALNRFLIFKSEKRYRELILPNGKPAIGQNHDYVIDCFHNLKVKGVVSCIQNFITPLEKEREKPIETPAKPLERKKEVFIIHGRDETQALRLQKYLDRNLKIKAKMFEDFKEESGSNTIIEQLEYIKNNVGYAFVIVTPDDLGCLREDIDKCRTTMLVGTRNITVKSVCDILDNLHTRARQNVVFEHGLFIATLGRDRVCCLLQEDTKEKPSDIDGILYVGFKKSVKEAFTEMTEKLKKAGLIKT